MLFVQFQRGSDPKLLGRRLARSSFRVLGFWGLDFGLGGLGLSGFALSVFAYNHPKP